ncbi:hypothetical protein H7U32_01105 [Bifidobacterium pullorum subsp. saeculare]|uniref:FtsK domain-containing protein n=1 Tax=Bifidobacterium pullorum subsp. saeculare TaxID=78257 RepID=A0A939B981_9BIFI|nr:hypothetical protein [Bifidobacterium pullorum]MBM6698945.1 hypothetical protein [Bifidobacterium pullorum subsp. saeculare]
MENMLAILAALVVAALMIWPLWTGIYDPEEKGRRAFTCAIATSVWTWWYLAHIDGMTWAATTLVILALALFVRPARVLLPLGAWLVSWRYRTSKKSATYFVERVIGLRPIGSRDYRADVTVYKDGETKLSFDCGVAGVTTETVTRVCEEALGAMRCVTVTVTPESPGRWTIRYYRDLPEDPLDDVHELAHLKPWNGTMVRYGVTGDGSPATLSFAQTSGIVVGGVPGAGKSAGAIDLVAPLLASDRARVFVFDGKGGADWEWAREAAASFYQDDGDIGAVADRLEKLDTEMRRDLRGHPWGTDPDFWHGGPSSEHPFHLVVIDECQTYFDATGLDKDGKAAVARCVRAVTDLVKKGRSAGWCCLLLTQKPTSEALPTAIRDNAAMRLAFRVTTAEAAKAVLGTIPDGDPSPTEIPASRRGGAVVQGEDGHTQAVRFYYMSPETAQQELARLKPTEPKPAPNPYVRWASMSTLEQVEQDLMQ